jgi:hypothetical protein
MESLGFLIGAVLLAGFIVLGLRSLAFGIRTRSKPDAVLGAVFLSIAASADVLRPAV